MFFQRRGMRTKIIYTYGKQEKVRKNTSVD